jgi:peptidoglycan/xylan/chitin deacetylase (PgdA/CDA1 family)
MRRLRALGAHLFAMAAALALGAGLAYATAEPSSAVEPSRASARVARSVGPPPLDLPPAPPRPVPEPLLPAPLQPVGERLRDGRVITGRTAHRLILFTFDDGPELTETPRLLDLLEQHGAKAVFFLTASRLQGRSDGARQARAIAREIARRGHLVGNHTVDHVQLPLQDDAGVARQVQGAEATFVEVLGERTWLLRPPGGARSPRVDRLLASWGYTQILWNLGTGDTQVFDADEIFRTWRRVLARRERESGDRGGIVLLHDLHRWSVDAFVRIAEHLEAENCRLLEEGEELWEILDDPSVFFRPRRVGPSQEAPVVRFTPEELEARQAPLRARTRLRCQGVARAD